MNAQASTFTKRKYKDRRDYAGFPVNDLRNMLARAEDRMTRTDTTENYLIDAYAAQEISAAIQASGAQL